jgi:hypothetical protein
MRGADAPTPVDAIRRGGDRLRTAQIIYTHRGGHVAWAQGDHPMLEAWLPAGSGAP